jgi:hypothetical protein
MLATKPRLALNACTKPRNTSDGRQKTKLEKLGFLMNSTVNLPIGCHGSILKTEIEEITILCETDDKNHQGHILHGIRFGMIPEK